MRTFMAAAAFAALTWSAGAVPQAGHATASTPAKPTVHVVKMLLTPDGKYRFEPAAITIKVGDTVQWVNASGGPHNVSFYPNKIPAGAADLLNAQMKNRIANLQGELLVSPNQTYDISFAGMPAGEYDYFCTPHEMLGMKGTITVTK